MHLRDSRKGKVERSRWAVLDRIDWGAVATTLSLSHREMEVVQRIVAGHKLDLIARELTLGLGTVKTYAARVRSKIGVHDHVGLVLAVLEVGLRRTSLSPAGMTHK